MIKSPQRIFRWPASLTFPLVLFVIVTCFYWKLVFTYQYDWIWDPDLTEQVLPWFEEEARQFHHGQFPLWDPHYWAGQPLLAQAQPGAAYPVNWLLWSVPLQNGHINVMALQWYYVAGIHYLTALFCYLLCRDLGRSRGAALAAALAFALAGYVGRMGRPQMVNGAVWAPLGFLFLLRAIRGVGPWASAWLCGVCLGMSWLSGHHQIPIFLTLAAGGVWLYYVFESGKVDWRVARLAAVSMAVAPIVGALQIIPAAEYGRLAWRWVGARDHVGWRDVVPYFVHAQYSTQPIDLVGFFVPTYNDVVGNFVGVVAIALGLLGVALCWREHVVKLFGAIALGGLIYALGSHSIFQGFIYAVVPYVEKARVPAMAVLLFDVGLAVTAAFGVDALGRRADSVWTRRMNLGITGLGIFLGGTILAILIASRLVWSTDDRVVVTCLIVFLLAALVYGWRKGSVTQPQAVALLVLLLLFELGSQSSATLADRNDWSRHGLIEKTWGNSDLADFLHRQAGPFRVETQTDEIVRNWGDYHDVDFDTAYAGVSVNSFELETHTPQTRKLLGVKYTLARAPTNGAQQEVFRGASGIGVYENPGAFPRAWAVHEIVPIRSADEGRVFIRDHVDELLWKALFMGSDAPRAPTCESARDSVTVVQYAPSRVALHANLTCDSMVVLADTYYPGWNATVDGKIAKIYEVDLAFRGVLVPNGEHDVVFRYQPRSVYLGAGLTLAGLIGAGVIAVASKRKSKVV